MERLDLVRKTKRNRGGKIAEKGGGGKILQRSILPTPDFQEKNCKLKPSPAVREDWVGGGGRVLGQGGEGGVGSCTLMPCRVERKYSL